VHGPRVATPAGTTVGRDAYLTIVDGEEIQLALYPADTLSQAREFYGRSDALDGVRALAVGDGWTVKPNFHFGHMQRGFCWTTSDIEVEDYLQIWEERIATAGNIPRDEWASYWSWLVERGIAKEDDRPEFERDFTETDRQTATPRPGLMLARRWLLAEAEDLDSRDAFAPAVRTALEEALAAVGEPGLGGAR
jgi:hypothetical protein